MEGRARCRSHGARDAGSDYVAMAPGAGGEAHQEAGSGNDEARPQSRVRTGGAAARRDSKAAPIRIRRAEDTGRLARRSSWPSTTVNREEIDLDRTDRLPILEGVTIDEDVEDDSVRLDYSGPAPPVLRPAAPDAPPQPAPDFTRPGMDLPSLAESVRSVEERIARQSADYEALNRLYEKARDGQLAAGTRADALASELSTLAVDAGGRAASLPRNGAGSLGGHGCGRGQPRPGGRVLAETPSATRARRALCGTPWRLGTRPSRTCCIRSESAMRSCSPCNGSMRRPCPCSRRARVRPHSSRRIFRQPGRMRSRFRWSSRRAEVP